MARWLDLVDPVQLERRHAFHVRLRLDATGLRCAAADGLVAPLPRQTWGRRGSVEWNVALVHHPYVGWRDNHSLRESGWSKEHPQIGAFEEASDGEDRRADRE